jgi:large subunit ribosomal protein L19
MDELLRAVEAPVNENVPEDLEVGDNVSVFLRIKEGNNERVQEFKGTVIRKSKGGVNKNFTVRRIASNGIGVERTFMMRSPRIEDVKIHRRSHVRRAKLYYLRERTGKRARLKQKFN